MTLCHSHKNNLTFDAAPPNGMALEVIIDNLINLQSSNLTANFTATDVTGGLPQTDFTLSDTPTSETNLRFCGWCLSRQDVTLYQILINNRRVIAGRGVTVYVLIHYY